MAVNNGVEEITGNHFEERIRKGLVVVDFWASWCFPCIIMSPVVEEMQEKFRNIKFAKVNVDENSELSRKYKVNSIPTLIVFKNGKEIERITGSLPADVLEEKLRKLRK